MIPPKIFVEIIAQRIEIGNISRKKILKGFRVLETDFELILSCETVFELILELESGFELILSCETVFELILKLENDFEVILESRKSF